MIDGITNEIVWTGVCFIFSLGFGIFCLEHYLESRESGSLGGAILFLLISFIFLLSLLNVI